MNINESAKWLINPDGNGCTDEEFAELMALMAKFRKSGNDTDINLTVQDMLGFNIDEFADWIRECLKEIIRSPEIDSSAWWKPQEDDDFKLTKSGKEKVDTFIAEITAKRKEILDAGLDTADETTLPDVEDIEQDIVFTGIDDDWSYYNSWGVTDSTAYDMNISLEYGEDFVPERLSDTPYENKDKKEHQVLPASSEQYLLLKTTVTLYEGQSDANTDIVDILTGNDAKRKAGTAFLHALQEELNHIPDIQCISLVWDGEDLFDEESPLYGIESINDNLEYTQELRDRQSLVYHYDDGFGTWTIVTLTVKKLT